MRNYAVLESGTNGNLVATANGTNLTYVGETGTDYYYEADGNPYLHEGGSAFSSKNGETYNFGQQPFTSTVDTSRNWTSSTSVVCDLNGSAVSNFRPLSNVYNGIIKNAGDFLELTQYTSGKKTYVFTFSPPIENVETAEAFIFQGNSAEGGRISFGNGWYDKTISGKYEWVGSETVPANGIITTLTMEVTAANTANSARNGLHAIKINGQVLTDPDAAVIEARNNRLYQTWEQWARTALGYAVDRIAKLEQRNVQLEALIEEARTRLAALELNEVSDDAVDTALITLIGNINDRLTVLEESN
jgi:hypothetical protein